MKKLFSFLFIVFSYSQAAYCQELHIDSTRFITGNRCCTQINYVIPTADNGILFVGSDVNNPGGIIPYFPYDTSTFENVLIGKIDSKQQISWIKVYGGSKDDNAISACQTPDGGYAVLATTVSSDGNVTGYKGGNDLWLLRIDALGNLLWEKTYGSSAGDVGVSVANTPDGGLILLGATNGSDGDVPFHYGGEFSLDWLVIKTDGLGNKQWSKDLGGTGDENEVGSILSVDNSYYLISSSNSTDHDCTDNTWHTGVNTNEDYYILKLDDTGKVLWDSSYGGSGYEGAYNAMYDTRDSTIVINGSTQSADYMVTGYQGGDGDMWVMKVNKNGTLIWQKTLGGSQQDIGTGICAGPDGGYMAYGGVSASTPPYIIAGGTGGADCWLFALDNAGKIIVSKLFGGPTLTATSSYSIIPYFSSYAAIGRSDADAFNEGTTYGNFDNGGPFISYIGYWPLLINNVTNSTGLTMELFPNPSHEKIKINISENIDGIVSIINSIGQEVYSSQINQRINNTEVNVAEWVNGVYLIKWQGAEGSVLTAKFVKQ